jgi:centromere protein X
MPPKPFKPPRPSTSSVRKTPKPKGPSTSTTKKSTTKSTSRASGSSAFSLPALDSDSEVDPFASQDARTQGPEEEEEEDAADVTVIPDEDDERRESIPPELLTRLLHEFFTHDNTRMSKDAGKAVGRYMETFVREAMARAAFMRAESDAQTGGAGDGFLEVCYPFAQMVLGLLEDS